MTFLLVYSLTQGKVHLENCYAMWKMESSQDDKHYGFIAMCFNATKSARYYLSHCQTNDDIETIAHALGSSRRL